MEQLLQVGIISSTHGLQGEVKVFPTTDDAKRFKRLKKVLLDTGKERITLEIQGVKFFKQFVIVKFQGIDSINEVEQYKGKSLLIDRKDAVKLEQNEYFIADLLGMKVYTGEEEFGTLKDVLVTGANEVYVVDTKEHKEVLLPAIRQCILEVDVEGRTMQVCVPKGLL